MTQEAVRPGTSTEASAGINDATVSEYQRRFGRSPEQQEFDQKWESGLREAAFMAIGRWMSRENVTKAIFEAGYFAGRKDATQDAEATTRLAFGADPHYLLASRYSVNDLHFVNLNYGFDDAAVARDFFEAAERYAGELEPDESRRDSYKDGAS